MTVYGSDSMSLVHLRGRTWRGMIDPARWNTGIGYSVPRTIVTAADCSAVEVEFMMTLPERSSCAWSFAESESTTVPDNGACT